MTESPKKSRVGPIRLIISAIIFLVIGGVWMMFQTGQMRAVEVNSNSMEPTIAAGDRLIVQLFKSNARPNYGQVVAMKSPDDQGPDLVKRVVGVPGDIMEVRRGMLFRNGSEEPPPAGGENRHHGVRDFSVKLGPDQFYVLGDNRPYSHDSTEFGAVDARLIYGEVTYRYSPWSKRGKVQ